MYDYSNSQSANYDYQRNVYAGYASVTLKLFDYLDVKGGCRYEYTEAKANFSNAGNVSLTPYSTYVPALALSHQFKNNQTIKLAYSHRIERPDYHDLNPFINLADPKNITTGNPNLQPEISDKVELGYSRSFEKKANINFTLFYRGNSHDIQSFTRYYPTYQIGDSTYTHVAITTRENIGHEHNIGLSIFGSIPLGKKISLRSNVNLFQRYIITGIPGSADIQGFNYRINANLTYEITSTMSVELFGNFNSPRINAQGTMPSFTTYNFAFRKQFMHKKASIALTATNPFNKYVNQQTQLNGENFSLNNTRQLPYRSFGINFTWKFGKLEFKKEREPEDINLTNPPSPGN
jgi:ferric enterobactin receptor